MILHLKTGRWSQRRLCQCCQNHNREAGWLGYHCLECRKLYNQSQDGYKMLKYEKGWTKMTNFADLDAMDDDDWDKVPNVPSRVEVFG